MRTHAIPRLLAAAGLCFALLGCERPFVEPREPDIEVLSPDFSVVQIDRDVLLQIRAESQNGVDSVLLNGIPLVRGESPGEFSQQIRLNFGLTTLVIEAFDLSGTRSLDTLRAVALPNASSPAEIRLPEPRGGHTALRLQTGRFMVAGGTPNPSQPASNAVWIYNSFDLRSAPAEYFMLGRRTEHTATLLPDGRVLLLGGAEVESPPTVNELVERVEVFDPEAGEFHEIPVRGDPIRRSGHTTIVYTIGRSASTEFFLYLYGGLGDVRYRPQPQMGLRADIRAFQFRNDSLIALGPTIGPFVDQIFDHAVTAIQPQIGNRAEYLVTGSYFVTDEVSEDVVFEAELATGTGFSLFSTGSMQVPRSGHAATRLVDAEILLFGGRGFLPTSATAENEVYYSQIGRFFVFPEASRLLQKRWGHTATNWDGIRIMILGGFGETGAALQTAEWFEIDRSG